MLIQKNLETKLFAPQFLQIQNAYRTLILHQTLPSPLKNLSQIQTIKNKKQALKSRSLVHKLILYETQQNVEAIPIQSREATLKAHSYSCRSERVDPLNFINTSSRPGGRFIIKPGRISSSTHASPQCLATSSAGFPTSSN